MTTQIPLDQKFPSHHGKVAPRLFQFLYHHLTQMYGSLVHRLQPFVNLSPLVLRLRVTKRCNLHCNYCYQADSLNQKENNHLNLEEWEKILERIPRWTMLDITGGEPFVAANFNGLMDLILSKGFRTSLISNGTRCDDETLELLVQKRLMYFMLSIDGLADTHDLLRGQKGAFEKVKSTIEKINWYKSKYKSKYPLICVKTTVTEQNYRELKDLHNYAFDVLKVNDQSLNLLFQNAVRGGNEIYDEMNERFYLGNTSQISKETAAEMTRHIAEVMSEARSRGRSLQFKPEVDLLDLEGYLSEPRHFGVKNCSKVHSVSTLYFDGSLSPCDVGLRVGNIRDLNYTLPLITKQKKYSDFYRKFKEDKSFRPYCEGCCLMPHQVKSV